MRTTKPAVTFRRLREATLEGAAIPLARLSLLLGCEPSANDDDTMRDITAVLGMDDTPSGQSHIAVRRLLQARGETDLADLIAAPTLSVDDYISNMGELFSR